MDHELSWLGNPETFFDSMHSNLYLSAEKIHLKCQQFSDSNVNRLAGHFNTGDEYAVHNICVMNCLIFAVFFETHATVLIPGKQKKKPLTFKAYCAPIGAYIS